MLLLFTFLTLLSFVDSQFQGCTVFAPPLKTFPLKLLLIEMPPLKELPLKIHFFDPAVFSGFSVSRLYCICTPSQNVPSKIAPYKNAPSKRASTKNASLWADLKILLLFTYLTLLSLWILSFKAVLYLHPL